MSEHTTKIVYIGAGSFRFTVPCALNILEFAETYHPLELWLVDIDATSLALMNTLLKQMVGVHKRDISIHSTLDRKKALPNADYVLISISLGIQKSEWFDIHIPLKFGIPQNTGDTVGPGGILRAVRTIPPIVAILNDINESCPDAIVLNYTNPQGTLMLSARQEAPNVQSIGLCHEFFHLGSKKFGRYLNHCGIKTTPKKKFKLLYGGVNHFSWVTKIEHDGRDIYPQLREGAEYAFKTGKFHRTFNYYMLKKTGYLCYVEDRHVTEFLPKYYNHFNYEEKPFGIKLRNVAGLDMMRHLVYSLIRWGQRTRNRWFVKMVLRPMEGGEKALLMIKDKLRGKSKHHVCNVLNNGTIPSLPDNCIVEVPCFFKDGKITASKVGPLPKPINDWVKIAAENQQLVVDAALSGNPEDLLKALLKDPMCQFIEDDDKVEDMMWNLLHYEGRWLPNFSDSIPMMEDLRKKKYFIEPRELMTVKKARLEKYQPDARLKQKAWPYIE